MAFSLTRALAVSLTCTLVVDLFLLGVRAAGHAVDNELFFDTLHIRPEGATVDAIRERATQKEINLRYFTDNSVRILFASCHHTFLLS